MGEDDDDYMNMDLTNLEEKSIKPDLSHKKIREKTVYKQKEASYNKPKSLKEEENRQEKLNQPIQTDNKGFKL